MTGLRDGMDTFGLPPGAQLGVVLCQSQQEPAVCTAGSQEEQVVGSDDHKAPATGSRGIMAFAKKRPAIRMAAADPPLGYILPIC